MSIDGISVFYENDIFFETRSINIYVALGLHKSLLVQNNNLNKIVSYLKVIIVYAKLVTQSKSNK